MVWGTASDGGRRGSGVVFQLALNRSATTTSVVSSANPSTFGNSVTFTASVTGGGSGSITFSDGETNIATTTLSASQAAFTTRALGPGVHTITAVYGGDSSHAGSKSSITQTVNALPSIAFSDDPLVAGRSMPFSTLIAPGLTIRAADVQDMRDRLK